MGRARSCPGRRVGRGTGGRHLPAPPPGHRLLTGADRNTRRRLAREDETELDFVFGELSRYRQAGYRITGLVLDRGDVEGPSGRAWFRRLEGAAQTHGVPLVPLKRVEELPDPSSGPQEEE